jgi:hypothetical protein
MAPSETQLSIETGTDWAICRIGGRLIPLRQQEAAELYRYVLQRIDHPRSELELIEPAMVEPT